MDWIIGTISVLLLCALASVLTMYLDRKDVGDEDIDSFIKKKINDGTKEKTNKRTTKEKN